jgi:general secretion pathway protein G
MRKCPDKPKFVICNINVQYLIEGAILRNIVEHERKVRTLVEILFIVIMLVLLTMLDISDTPKGTGRSGDGQRRTSAIVQIEEIEYALDIYRKHNGFYPTTKQGLEALVIKPTTDPLPEKYVEGGYLKKVPLDPLGNSFIYRCHGIEGPIDIICCGPDGDEGTEDDITNHN